jgi:inosose dehydratase
MNIAYGTYGMPGLDLEVALPKLAEMGYDGVEVAVGPKYPTMPDQLDAGRRRELRALLDDLGLQLPALMITSFSMLTEDPSVHEANLRALHEAARLGLDLAPEKPPALTFTLGGRSEAWLDQRDRLVRTLADYAKVAEETGCTLAAEPHYGSAVDRPERAVWLIETIGHPLVRLNFDISHFTLLGLTLEETVPVMVPYSVHTHVKDGRRLENGIEFLLPGAGGFDYGAYLRAMRDAGWTGPITVEITAMIWTRPDYDPFPAAAASYATLDAAFQAAGVERG